MNRTVQQVSMHTTMIWDDEALLIGFSLRNENERMRSALTDVLTNLDASHPDQTSDSFTIPRWLVRKAVQQARDVHFSVR